MLVFKLSLRYLFTGKLTTRLITAVSLIGTFIATASLILTLGVMNGFQKAVGESILKHTPHVVILTADETSARKVLEKVKSRFAEEVDKAFWFASYQLIFQHGKYVSGGVVYASEGKTLEEMLSLKKHLIAGNLTDDGLVLGVLLAQNLGLEELPAEITLVNPMAEETPIGFIPQMEVVNATGVFSTGFYAYDTSAVANYKFISELFKPSSFSVVVQLKNPFGANLFKEKLEGLFPDLFVNTWIDRNRDFFAALRLEKIASALVVGLIALVAVFNVFSLLLIKVGELKRDFAIFRTFGAGRRFIFSLVLLQGLIIGGLGATLGVVFSLMVTFGVNRYKLISVPPDVYLVSHVPIVNDFWDYLLVVAAVVGMSTAAALVPAYVSARERISRILRND